ncbi:hypothetical protein GLOTRDRAFT_128260 [Gloeophyllum trabeum ATCC 11539]|uniref:Ion transport domain-containing protein n=1 Tax=Gloeophyllum trabeum (strain ATCC 11539 / FP-39264 / Madison 617) TaxID=670483 RepID=S7Q8J9_GLOTA|nr:uncharacterized protein GLOTRDRAFT_128260 [Gloeophyllum trabeum ATCC 11539]EPQ56311.1 hypothetical protein GLOTRDRAFT_128260 [Gloeophyllum trabeum ATCC 11539]
MSEAQREQQPLLRAEEIEQTAVYPIIHMIKSDVMHFIDTPLTYDALTAPDLTYTLVRPLEDKYNAFQRQGNMSIVFCFLINRVHFLRDQSLTTSQLSRSRAALCEILAIRALNAHAHSLLELALVTTTSWPVYNGADPDVITQAREERDELEDRVGNAIEMAIISKAKRFIKSSACQKVINAIWIGKCVYQAESNHSILSDTYKRNPIHFYDPHKAPLLDHYRLKVPAIRMVLEYLDFLLLFILFVFALELNQRDRVNIAEGAFMVYALGFALEKVAAMQEHGIRVYFTGTWNGFDLAFVTVYCTYAFLRLYGVYHDNFWARSTGIDLLAVIAVLMFPRLVFVTLRNNLMVLSVRAMLVQFVILMFIAAFCFAGFLYALWTLSRNSAGYSAGQIAWWMADLWFGLDASGFDKASQFHPIFGPIMMIAYACLSNTLLLTVLVSILSHTFSTISEDAQAEAMFRRAVTTIEGVKADPLFSYLPPINLVALCIMFPLSYVLSPRWFHKAKTAGTLSFYDTVSAAAEKVFDTLPRQLKRLTFFEGLAGADSSIDAIFEIEDEMGDSALDTQDYDDPFLSGQQGPRRPSERRLSAASRRRPSFAPLIPPKASSQQISNGQPSASGGGGHVPVRQRVNSAMARGAEAAQSFTSPLAQIFQPLVVDDDIPEEARESPSNAPGPTHMISFGPATRRRLTSVHRRSTTDPYHLNPMQSSPKKFPSVTSDARSHGSLLSQPLSESPGQGEGRPETASHVEEDEGSPSRGGPGSGELMKRFDLMEERQRRIEELLMQLTQNLGSK